ncbi:RDD family protein [Paenibacillus qinlingensis]|uniref:RDD family membrane protein YckC n=1 Tax=Paenibacillus qinlingensis TaxID=1837343 RepID=A0ABU1NXJ1_9BACL|nr:RDD family protein [Paenibacillus qinlingensis]MDR6551557.1 putative RDD family membrane protein YckC [Paenibacillus qinlingensis]
MTIEQIVSQYRFGMIARRWGALWVDGVILWILPAIPVITLGEGVYQKTLWLWIALLFSYIFVMEGLLGWTIGKWLFRIRVVNVEGKAPGLVKAFIRTFLKVFEANPMMLGGGVAGIVALISKKRQRLGDMLAKTYVVKREDVSKITPLEKSAEAEPSFVEVVRTINEPELT